MWLRYPKRPASAITMISDPTHYPTSQIQSFPPPSIPSRSMRIEIRIIYEYLSTGLFIHQNLNIPVEPWIFANVNPTKSYTFTINRPSSQTKTGRHEADGLNGRPIRIASLSRNTSLPCKIDFEPIPCVDPHVLNTLSLNRLLKYLSAHILNKSN